MKKKLYIIHSEYVQHGITFNSNDRYVEMLEDANELYERLLKEMKEDNEDMISDKENYKVNQMNRRGNRFYYCFYKYQPMASNFSVEMKTVELE